MPTMSIREYIDYMMGLDRTGPMPDDPFIIGIHTKPERVPDEDLEYDFEFIDAEFKE